MIRCLSVCLFLIASTTNISMVSAQTAKPDNPQKLNLDLIVVTHRTEGSTAKKDAELATAVEEVVKKHESHPLSRLQDAISDVLPESSEKVASDVNSFSLKSFSDLEQWVKFGTSHPVRNVQSPYGNVETRLLMGETEVKATPWILDEERFGIGVTVLRHLPAYALPQRTRAVEGVSVESLSFTSNTLLNANEAAVINTYRHRDAKLGLTIIVIARVSR